MENDLIRRGDAFTQFQKQYIDTQEGTDHVAIRINIGITKCIHAMQDIPAVDAVPWKFLERYADWFCAAVSMPEFIREAKAFYKSTNEAMKGGHIDG